MAKQWQGWGLPGNTEAPLPTCLTDLETPCTAYKNLGIALLQAAPSNALLSAMYY